MPILLRWILYISYLPREKSHISTDRESYKWSAWDIGVLSASAYCVSWPCFSINLKKAKELLSAIKAANLNLEYSAELHLKNIDEFIGLASEANFSALKFGIESAFSHIRDSVKRISKQWRTIRTNWLSRNTISNQLGCLLAQPSDTYETCEETINMHAINLDIAQFSVFTPIQAHVSQLMEPEITAQKFEDYTQFKLNFEHTNLTSVQVRAR